jgi:AraC family transcriptional regulator
MLQEPEWYFQPETEVEFSGITAHIGTFDWRGPFDAAYTPADVHRISLHLARKATVSLGRYLLDGDQSEFGRVGDLTFAPARSQFHHRSDGVAQRVIYFDIHPVAFGPAHALLGEGFDKRDLQACLDIPSDRSKQRMLQLAEEISAPGFASPLLIESLMVAVAVDVARHLRDRRSQSCSSRSVLERWQLRRIDDLINDLSGGAPTIAGLAEACGVSRGHFSRLFRATTGQSVHAYVAGVRLDRAKALMCDTRLSLKTISFQLGFSSQAAFSYAFSKSTGVSPRKFRQRYRGMSRG